jgi:hypothetical protein
MRTVAEPVEGTEVRVEPSDTPGITINGTPASLDAVRKADVRVDLAAGDRPNAGRSFVVEHVLGPLGLHSVTAATVTGVREDWDFARPEHRFCYSADLGPGRVVGHPAGLANPALSAAVDEGGVVGEVPPARTTVAEPFTYEANDGEIRFEPRGYGEGVRFSATYGEARFEADVDPAGENDADLVDAVVNSTTPYLSPTEAEAVTHSMADLVSDVAVIGGFEDLLVEVDLGEAYHALTVGGARAAREAGLAVDRGA